MPVLMVLKVLRAMLAPQVRMALLALKARLAYSRFSPKIRRIWQRGSYWRQII